MIQKRIITIIFLFFLVVLQSTFFAHLNIKGASPNFVLIIFILVAFFSHPKSNFLYILAPISGIFLDFFSVSFGIHFITFSVLALVLKKFSSLIARKDILTVSVLLLISLIVYQIVIIFFYSVFSGIKVNFSFGGLIYNLILGLIFYYLYVFYKKKIKS